MSLTAIKALVANELSATDQLIISSLKSNVPLIEAVGEHIVQSGGKRIRPLVTLLCAKACGYSGDKHITLATIVEFIHTATLLHDDVVDTSAQRRGRPTANAIWDNAASVLTGDFVYSRAFELMVKLDDIEVLRMLAQASNRMAEGEVAQLANCHKIDLSETDYFEVIEGKTATLFAAACSIAARLADRDQICQQALYQYGNALGCAFQIIDDVLDYTADAKTLGKNIGDDLVEGKLTLPLIYALKRAKGIDRSNLEQIIRNADVARIPELCRIIDNCGALDTTFEQAKTLGATAIQSLAVLPDGVYRSALQTLMDLVIHRDQ
jgi:octaprenyl-diphosphate synthase